MAKYTTAEITEIKNYFSPKISAELKEITKDASFVLDEVNENYIIDQTIQYCCDNNDNSNFLDNLYFEIFILIPSYASSKAGDMTKVISDIIRANLKYFKIANLSESTSDTDDESDSTEFKYNIMQDDELKEILYPLINNYLKEYISDLGTQGIIICEILDFSYNYIIVNTDYVILDEIKVNLYSGISNILYKYMDNAYVIDLSITDIIMQHVDKFMEIKEGKDAISAFSDDIYNAGGTIDITPFISTLFPEITALLRPYIEEDSYLTLLGKLILSACIRYMEYYDTSGEEAAELQVAPFRDMGFDEEAIQNALDMIAYYDAGSTYNLLKAQIIEILDASSIGLPNTRESFKLVVDLSKEIVERVKKYKYLFVFKNSTVTTAQWIQDLYNLDYSISDIQTLLTIQDLIMYYLSGDYNALDLEAELRNLFSNIEITGDIDTIINYFLENRDNGVFDVIIIDKSEKQYEDLIENENYENNSNWIDLDDKNNALYLSNHFGNGQCYVKVEFNNGAISKSYNLPVYPEDISYSLSTNYSDSDIIGRTGKISTYNNTNDPTSSFQLHLHRELHTYNNSIVDKNEIDAIVALIQAAQYPYYGNNCIYAPITTYRFGDTVIIGKQSQANVKWTGPKINGAYMEVTIDISITLLPNKILSFNDVFNKLPRQLSY